MRVCSTPKQRIANIPAVIERMTNEIVECVKTMRIASDDLDGGPKRRFSERRLCGLRLTDEPGESGNATAFLNANPNRVLLVGRSHGAIVTGARLEEDLESFLHTS